MSFSFYSESASNRLEKRFFAFLSVAFRKVKPLAEIAGKKSFLRDFYSKDLIKFVEKFLRKSPMSIAFINPKIEPLLSPPTLHAATEQKPREAIHQTRNDLLALSTIIQVFDRIIKNHTEDKEYILANTPLESLFGLRINALEVDAKAMSDLDDKEEIERKIAQLYEAFIDVLSDLDCIEQEKELLEEFNKEIRLTSLPSSTWDLEKITIAAKKRIQVIGILEDAPVAILNCCPSVQVQMTLIGKKLEKLFTSFPPNSNEFGGQNIRVFLEARYLMKIKEGESSIIRSLNTEVKIHCRQSLHSKMRFEEMLQHLITSANLGIMQFNPSSSWPQYKQYELVQSLYRECRPSWRANLVNPRYPSRGISIFQPVRQFAPPYIVRQVNFPRSAYHPSQQAGQFASPLQHSIAVMPPVRMPSIAQVTSPPCQTDSRNEEGRAAKRPRL